MSLLRVIRYKIDHLYIKLHDNWNENPQVKLIACDNEITSILVFLLLSIFIQKIDKWIQMNSIFIIEHIGKLMGWTRACPFEHENELIVLLFLWLKNFFVIVLNNGKNVCDGNCCYYIQ